MSGKEREKGSPHTVNDQNAVDLYDPESYAPEDKFPAQMWNYEDGFTEQWRLLAEHVWNGGDAASAPYPDLSHFNQRFPRSAVEGIQQARSDAQQMIAEGVFDAAGIVETMRVEDEERRRLTSAQALVDGGEFEPPSDLAGARLHTTITRAFTDPVVHDVRGVDYEPVHWLTKRLSLDGPVLLLGYGEIDLGTSLSGEYQLDVVNVDSTGPGSGVTALRMVWGDPSTIVGAVAAGKVNGPNRWVGIGHQGASWLIHEEGHRIYGGDLDRLPLIHDDRFGWSAWFWSAHGGYDIFLAVDADRRPVGIILDSSVITRYYTYDENGYEVFQPWPDDAREFDPRTDAPQLWEDPDED